MAEKEGTSGNDKAGQANTEPEIEIVEGDGDQGGAGTQQQAGDERAGNYEYPDDEGDDQGQQADARAGNREQGQETRQESQEQLTARQRRRRADQARRDRERQELIRLRQENEQLKNGQVLTDRRLANLETSTIDGQIASLEAEVARCNTVMSRAVVAQNGDDFAAAQDIRDTLRDRLVSLKNQKAAQAAAARGDSRGAAAGGSVPGVTAQQQRFARIFMGRHRWYAPNTGDADSIRVEEIDSQLTREGGNPLTPEYWIELEARVREELPHRFQTADTSGGEDQGGGNNGQGGGVNNRNGGKRPRGPRIPGPAGGGGNGGNGGGGPQRFHLSAERKQALIDLGVDVNDREAIMPYVKRFMAWDAANPTKQ